MDFVTEAIAKKGRPDLSVDVFKPQGEANGVAVILLHGGVWMFGDRSDMHRYAKLLAERGFLAIAAQYGLLPHARWPRQLEDVRDVIRWTKSQAKRLNIAPAKVVTVGFSAGAHLALLAAGTSDGSGHEQALGDGAGTSVAAVVSCFAPAVLTSEIGPRLPQLDMLLDGGDDDKARRLSPISYVNPAFPTTFLVTGGDDIAIPSQVTLRLYQDLSQAGAQPELHVFHAQNHEFTALPSICAAFIDEVAFFLHRTVIDPDHFADENRRLNLFAQPDLLARLQPPAGDRPPTS